MFVLTTLKPSCVLSRILSWEAIFLSKKSIPGGISPHSFEPRIYRTGPDSSITSESAIQAVNTPFGFQKGQYWISRCHPALPFCPPPAGFQTDCECHTWIFFAPTALANHFPKSLYVMRFQICSLHKWGLSILIMLSGSSPTFQNLFSSWTPVSYYPWISSHKAVRAHSTR